MPREDPFREDNDWIWTAAIAGSLILAIAVAVFSLSRGLLEVFPHLFYIPIVLTAYRRPERALRLTALIGIIYLLLVWVFTMSDSGAVVRAAIRVGVFLWVAAIIAYLSGHLKSQEMKYRGIFNNSSAGVALVTLGDHLVREANRRFAAMLGYGNGELLDRNLDELWPDPAVRDQFLGEIRSLGALADREATFAGKGGQETDVILSAGKLSDREAIITAVDNSQQKRDRELLAASNRRLLDIIEFLPDATFVIDREKKVIAWNRAVEEMTGVPKEAIIGRGDYAYAVPWYGKKRPVLIDLIGMHDPSVEAAYQNLQRKGDTLFAEVFVPSLYRGRGAHIWVKASPLYDERGAVVGAIESVRDISDMKNLVDAFRRHNLQLSVMNEIIGAAASLVTRDEIETTVARKITELLRYDMAAIYVLGPGEGQARLQAEHAVPLAVLDGIRTLDLASGGLATVFSREAISEMRAAEVSEVLSRDGLVSVVGVPLTSGEGVLGALVLASRRPVVLLQDERIMLESIGKAAGSALARAMLHQELEGAYQKANLYLDIMAHDINNANMASLGYAQLLAEGSDGQMRDYALKLEQAVQQSIEIIKNVSTIRRIQEQAVGRKVIALEPVIRTEIARHPLARVHYDGTTALVLADDLLSEIFTNLIGNSVKFSRGGPEVWIRVEDQGGEVQVSVEDNGPGIPDDLKGQIFNRFQKGKSRKSGKGLGLYICRMLVEQYGGRIWADDRVPGHPEEGAAIRLTLVRAGPGSEQ